VKVNDRFRTVTTAKSPFLDKAKQVVRSLCLTSQGPGPSHVVKLQSGMPRQSCRISLYGGPCLPRKCHEMPGVGQGYTQMLNSFGQATKLRIKGTGDQEDSHGPAVIRLRE